MLTSNGPSRTVRVLLVDDDTELGELVGEYLAREGFSLEIEADGTRAVDRALSGDFRLIVLDVMLPGVSGFDILRHLRAASRVPVLMLTARGDDVDRIVGLELGADDYLSKPFSYVVLLARLRALLRRAPLPRDPVLVTGDLRLDPATAQCWRGDTEVELTAREFALAEYLLRRKGQVVSKASIAEHVWDADLDIDSNVIEVYISYLRRKLDRPFGRGDIETVRGLGYRLRDRPVDTVES